MPNCSVIIPVFNQEEYLAEAIESALAQTVPVEVIVVDDGSIDDSFKIASKYPVKLVSHMFNRGLSAARNTGIRHAQGVRILCLDSDDTIEPTMVEKCQNIQGVAVVGVHNFGDRLEAWVLPYQDLTLEAFKIQNRITCCSMFDKKDWQAVGGFDEEMKLGKEDYDFWLSLLKREVKFTPINELLFNYRMKADSMALRADSMEQEILEYIHNKHKDLWT